MKKYSLKRLIDRSASSEGMALMIMAIIVGGCTGLAAVFFIRLIAFIQRVSYSGAETLFPFLGRFWFVIIPVLGALVVGPIITKFAIEAKGHGVPEVMQALILRGGRIRARVAAAKIAASAICIGTGGSAGREGPIVQVGSALGSCMGQWLGLSDNRIKNLVACGAAAGIAATFNAPIAGVIFAMEVLISGFQVSVIGNVVIASVSASIVSRIFLGARPAFEVPNYIMSSSWEIILYMILGIFAALTGIMFIKMLNTFENLFDNWNFPQTFKPAVGALLLGITAFAYPHMGGPMSMSAEDMRMGIPLIENIPHVFGSGFSFLGEVLKGNAPFWLLVILIFLKPLATSFTLGSGNSGGVFAPALFTGAVLGGAFGYVANALFPGIAGNIGAYALVGMAAAFAAAAHAPLTSMLIVFEMSNDYHLILPLMAACMVASCIAQRLQPDSIYTIKLTKKGIHFEQGHDLDIMQSVMVEEVMNQSPVTLHKDQPLADIYRSIQETHFQGFPVMSNNEDLYGIVTLQDVERVLSSKDVTAKDLRILDITSTPPTTVYPDELIWAAIQKMGPRDLARLPVISRHGKNKLVGLISRSDIVKAYNVGLIRKRQAQFHQEQMTLRNVTGVKFLDFCVLSSCPLTGKRLADTGLPLNIKIVSIEHAGTMLIPNGDTIIQAGDRITIICTADKIQNVRDYFKTG